MNFPRALATGLALSLAIVPYAHAQSGFYKCVIKGQAPIYQDFPCLKGKGGPINGASTREAIEGLLRHGYYGDAKQYADAHGVSQAEFDDMVVSVRRDHEASERTNRRIVEQRRMEAAQKEAMDKMRAAAEIAALSDPSLYSHADPVAPDESPQLPEPSAPAAQPWTPGNPTFDPEHNRWCQATSPSTTHCW